MKVKLSIPVLKDIIAKIDWQFLLFLMLVLNVKVAVKVAAIIIAYLLQWNFHFGFNLRKSRLPVFYLLVIIIAVINWIIYRSFLHLNYNIAFITGIGFWIICILIIHQVKLFIDRNDIETIHKTIITFCLLNAVVSFAQLAIIVIETSALNPYLYQGEYQKYFISTGDYIKGISFDTSTTNAVLNVFCIIYFLWKKNVLMLLLCMIILVLTASNFTSLFLLITFAGLFILKSDSNQKSLMVVCTMILVVFMAKISPQNNQYVSEIFGNYLPAKKTAPVPITPQIVKSDDEVKVKIIPVAQHIDTAHAVLVNNEIKLTKISNEPAIVSSLEARTRPTIPQPDINTAPYQQRNDTTDVQQKLFQFIDSNRNSLSLSSKEYKDLSLPGKLVALQQTLRFLRQHPGKIFFGDGIGNFSSKLAYRTTGFKIEGGYPAKLKYISADFLSNHLDVYLYFFSNRKGLHSIVNTTDSVYDQLLSEYGIAGVAGFFMGYMGFFFNRIRKLTYGFPLVFLMLNVFTMGYWFEQLSVVILFELLMLLDIKEGMERNNNYAS